MRKNMNVTIRKMHPEEYGLLREFLYQAIYLPEGVQPPSRSVVDLPELQVYLAGFGARPGDHCLVAEAEGAVIGAAWCRIMEDYGHIDDDTPSLAISLLPGYRGGASGPGCSAASCVCCRKTDISGHPSRFKKRTQLYACMSGRDFGF